MRVFIHLSLDRDSGMASTHRVLYDFESTGSGILAVSKGEYCTLLNKLEDSGWCSVRTSKGSGLVPSNYLQPLQQVRTVNRNRTCIGVANTLFNSFEILVMLC